MQAVRTRYLEALQWLSPAKFGEKQNALHQGLGERVMSCTFERQVNELHILGQPY